MHQKIKRWVALFFACLFLMNIPLEAMAATKPINTVNVRISSKLKPGTRLPEIQIGSGNAPEEGILVTETGTHFKVIEASWIDNSSKELVAADEPRMTVTLQPDDVSEYYFLANYKESNVKVSGGSFVSARRDGDNLVVTVRVNPVKGTYDSPRDAYWNDKNLGEAKWTKSDNDSGYYEVQLLRSGKNVFKIDKTSATNYNFYPYMTQTGNYTFKVRTIPGTDFQTKYGKRSDWVESGELDIGDRYVSDGKGQKNSNSTAVKGTEQTVGWSKEGDGWKYRYPNGSLCMNQWENINGLWYYFDGNGNMLTGWQHIAGEWYFLYDDGQMAVGWARIGDKWYYFRPEKEGGYSLGSMVSSGWRVIGGYYYYFNQDGTIYTGWLNLDNKWYYLNVLDNSLQGAMFTGWIIRDEKTYFADFNGEVVEGWYQIDGLWYYFYPGSKEMARDTQIDGFYIDSNGVWR